MSDKTSKEKEKLRAKIAALLQAEFGVEILEDEPILQVALSNTAVLEILIDKIEKYQEEKTDNLLEKFTLIEELNQDAFKRFLSDVTKTLVNNSSVQQKEWLDNSHQLLKKHLIKTETLLKQTNINPTKTPSLIRALSIPILILLSFSNSALLLLLLFYQS